MNLIPNTINSPKTTQSLRYASQNFMHLLPWSLHQIKRIYRDMCDVKRINQELAEARRFLKVRTIKELPLARIKKSDMIYILGSGSSISSLSERCWRKIMQHDSIGINFWCLHDFVPTYYFFEFPRDPDRLEAMIAILGDRFVDYRYTYFVLNYRPTQTLDREITALPHYVTERLYLNVSYSLPTAAKHLVALSLYIWHAIECVKGKSFSRIIHHRATLSAAVMFAYLAGYKHIVLLGVDLNNSKYFYEDNQSYSKYSIKSGQIHPNNIHRTVDPAITRSYGYLPIDEYLAILDSVVLKPGGSRLYSGSKESRLYPIFPYYQGLDP